MDQQIKLKRLIKKLNDYEGSGTSMISLLIPGNDKLHTITSLLTTEYGSASNIKNRVNRQSVEDAIVSVQQKLKLYNKIPTNGLIIYSGIINDKRVIIDFEPFKPLVSFLYKCDSKFHTNELSYLLQDDKSYGYIIIDGNSTLFGTLNGFNKNIIYEYSVNLPNKQGRGGQSQNRFQRIREEKRHNYLVKVGEFINKYFLGDNGPNVEGIIIAGSAEFKEVLYKSDLFDPRLKNIVISIIDIPYGSSSGFHEAIYKSKEIISNKKINDEITVLTTFFQEIEKDTNLFAYGYKNTMTALEAGASKILIISEKFAEKFAEKFKEINNNKNDSEDSDKIFDDLIENYQKYGTELIIVSDLSTYGNQFLQGFGGIGSILKYEYIFDYLENDCDDCDDFDDFI